MRSPRDAVTATRDDAASPVVAAYGGRQLTLDEVDRRVGADLEQQRRSALAQMVDEDLLRMEAARRGITLEQLVRDEIESKVVLPSDDEIAAAYRQIRADGQIPPSMSFERYKAALLETSRRQGEDALRQTYLASLRQKANLELKLPAPDMRVVVRHEGDATMDRRSGKAPPQGARQRELVPPAGHGAGAERPTLSPPDTAVPRQKL